jgi:hypothetical protein
MIDCNLIVSIITPPIHDFKQLPPAISILMCIGELQILIYKLN